MKDGKTQSQIAKLMDRHKSTISREIARNTGNRGYRPKQACLLAEERSLGSRNASQITASDWGKAVDCLLAQWSPVQIANQVGLHLDIAFNVPVHHTHNHSTMLKKRRAIKRLT